MGYYLSQVKFPRSKKPYWFRSDGCPLPGAPCTAWANGKTTSGTVLSYCYVDNEANSEKLVQTVTGRALSSIAPLITYTRRNHHDGKIMYIDHIQVPDAFQARMPSPRKIAEKYQRIVCAGEEIPLVVEKPTNILRDGYASFLIYRMLGKDAVPVIRVPTRK